MAKVHRTAIVEDGALLADDVTVGPFTTIGAEVTVGSGTSIGAHAVVEGRTRIGRGNRIFPFSALGGIPQDKKYAGEPTQLVIGDDNTIREYCTINVGTTQDRGITRIGDRNWIMAYVHIAHDCVVGNDTIFANSAQIAGHVAIADHVVLGAFVGVHQFCRIGVHAMAAAGSIVLQDVPPYVMAAGFPAKPRGTNSEGLRRRGFNTEDIAAVRRAYRTLYRSQLTLEAAKREVERAAERAPVLAPLLEFLATAGRGIVR